MFPAGPAIQSQVEDPEVEAVVQGVVPAEEVELGEMVAPVEERNTPVLLTHSDFLRFHQL